MPVLTLMYSSGLWSGAMARASPSARRLTSFSQSTGQPNSACSVSATGKPSHPGMIGGFTATPRLMSTGPGNPITRTSGTGRGCSIRASRALNTSMTVARTDSGPSATSSGISEAASISSLRSCTLSRANRTPRSATSTKPNARLKPRLSAGRPRPIIVRAPIWQITPPSCSMSSPLVTVVLARPVTRTRSARVTAAWLAISRANVLATDSMLTRADTAGTDSRRPRAPGILVTRTLRAYNATGPAAAHPGGTAWPADHPERWPSR